MKSETVIREKCGTRNGYQKHYKENEEPCPPCREANTVRFRRWYQTQAQNERDRNKRHRQSPLGKEQRNRANQRRRAHKRNTESEEYSTADILHIYGVECHICQGSIDLRAPRKVGEENWEKGLHLDHVIPLSKGGGDLIINVKPSHAYCNIAKNARTK